MSIKSLTIPQRISAISILVTVLASFLPWATFFGVSALGIEGDGVITLALALVGGVILGLTTGLFGKRGTPGKASQITLLVLAALTALIGLLDMSGVAAIGLYLTLFAGLAWVVGAIWQLSLSKQSTSDATTTN